MTDGPTRRGFLKGILAAAALAATTPPLLLQAAEILLPEPEETKFPLTQKGELWIHRRADWHLIGGLVSLTVTREPMYDFGDFGFRQVAIMPQFQDAELEYFADAAGFDLLRGSLMDNDRVHVGMAWGEYDVVAEDVYLDVGDVESGNGYLRGRVSFPVGKMTTRMR